MISDNKKCYVKLTDSVLLAPTWESSITKKADRGIKSALFQFLKTANLYCTVLYCKLWTQAVASKS